MDIAVIGTGYVGLVTGLTFAHLGHRVHLVDVIPERIEALRECIAPFYEPGLEELLLACRPLLHPTLDLAGAVSVSDVSFICVGTPPLDDGSQDTHFVVSAAREIAEAVSGREGPHTVVVKSTVEPGTTRDVVLPILVEGSGRSVGSSLGLCMNPEFLREGSAIDDSLHPDRVVIGEEGTSGDILAGLYGSLDAPIIRVSLETAEMIKYASNSFLATKISFANEMANICERLDIDALDMFRGVGMDSRISDRFLVPGFGFGGSCFPKDVKAIVSVARRLDEPVPLLDSVLERNELQPQRVVPMLMEMIGPLDGLTVTLLGAAFKPDTDDVRESRAFPIVRALMEAGARVRVHDPMALENFERELPGPEYIGELDVALLDADAVVINTDWKEYHDLSPGRLERLMKQPVVLDARRTLASTEGLNYRAVGLPYGK